MKVLGSGGAVPFPKPGCDCQDCKKAKEEGIPYERISSSLFCYPDILIDTPEEVFRRMIEFGISNLNHIFYTHWHPDHTQGSRLFEMWVKSGFAGKQNKNPLKVYLPDNMISDFVDKLPVFDFYQKQKFISIESVKDRKPVVLDEVSIIPVDLKREDRVRYAYLIKNNINNKKIMYAPCSVFGAKIDHFWKDLNVLFLETGWRGDTTTLRKKEVEPWFKDHISLEECFDFFKKLKPDRLFFTHLEGTLHQTYDNISEKTKNFENINVAFDGMDLKL